MGGWIGLVVAALLVVSGCSAAPAVPNSTSFSSTVNANTGSATLSGLVTDEELVPLPAAVIQVLPTAGGNGSVHSLESDADGRFTLRGVAGGAYTLFASRLGYEAASPIRLNLVDGETTNVSIRLVALAVATPFRETVPYTTYFHWYACVVSVVTSYCPLLVFDGTNSTRQFDAKASKGDLHTLIVESKWTASIPGCVQAMRTAAYSPEQQGLTQFPGPQTGPYYWDNLPNVTSPTRLVIPRTGTEDAMLSPGRTEANGDEPLGTAGKWSIQVFPTVAPANQPVALQCTIDQRVNVWITGFYHAPAAADWSAVG